MSSNGSGSRGEGDGGDPNRAFSLLADGRRRRLLRVLHDAGTPVSMAELARRTAAREADGDPSDETVRRLLVSLHHVHLPKLREANLVAYDPDRGTVAPTGELSAVLPLLLDTTN